MRRLNGKRRLNFATFITKERLTSPAANQYHVDSIAHVNFMIGKLSAQSWHIVKAVFHILIDNEQFDYEVFRTKETAKLNVIDYLAFYNGKRGYSKLSYQCPIGFEREFYKKTA
jgi:hypothetical protein